MKFVRMLFAMEVAVNAISGPLLMIAPRLALGPLLGGDEAIGEEVEEVGRWFGCMIFTFGCVLLGYALQHGSAELLKAPN